MRLGTLENTCKQHTKNHKGYCDQNPFYSIHHLMTPLLAKLDDCLCFIRLFLLQNFLDSSEIRQIQTTGNP